MPAETEAVKHRAFEDGVSGIYGIVLTGAWMECRVICYVGWFYGILQGI